jgi:cellulose synthase/poly-beta-1,6-N-acetylglucosamine synthase-like glycosyltransferase
MHGVFMGTPSTREFSAAYVMALFLTQLKGSLSWQTIQGQAIDVGRNALIRQFMRSKLDYLLMHDSDATWHPGAIQRLMDRNLPVVTGVIFKRNLPTVPTIGKDMGPSALSDGSHLYSFAGTINTINQVVKEYKIGGDTRNELLLPANQELVQEIDGAGAHFMLIRRDVLEKMPDPWYECTSGPNAGEDFDFCRKVQRAGFKLCCDFSVFTGHVLGPGLELGLREFMLYSDRKEITTLWTA